MHHTQKVKGWTAGALQAAATELHMSPMFAGVCTEADLVEHFIMKCNDALFRRIAQAGPDFEQKRTMAKINTALRWRLEMLAPYIGARGCTARAACAVRAQICALCCW